jgi:hypothetical protein
MQSLEHWLAAGLSGNHITQRSTQLGQEGCFQQEGFHLLGQVVEDFT